MSSLIQVSFLQTLLKEKKQIFIEHKIDTLLKEIPQTEETPYRYNGHIQYISTDFLVGELHQIREAKTVERQCYYIRRLIKSLTQKRTNKINDINLNRWKTYDDILTDSLWHIKKRDNSGSHTAKYWGNFVPQIPHQFIRRYTKLGEWILDPFLGSGTSLIEAQKLGRNGIGIEIQKDIALWAKQNITTGENPHGVTTHIEVEDNLNVDYIQLLEKYQIKQVQLVILHPPYWDIIKFSTHQSDMSNAATLSQFLVLMESLVEKVATILEKNRYMVLIISDKYEAGEWIPMAFRTMDIVLKKSFKLKSTIVKNFEETKGKANTQQLWRYRALAGGFYLFKHEYIFLFEKK